MKTEIELLREIADEASKTWGNGWLALEAITLKNLLTDLTDFKIRSSQPIAPADGGECCGCEYLGKCEDDPQKADYCPLRR